MWMHNVPPPVPDVVPQPEPRPQPPQQPPEIIEPPAPDQHRPAGDPVPENVPGLWRASGILRQPSRLAPLVVAGVAVLSACDREPVGSRGQGSTEAVQGGGDSAADRSRDIALASAVKSRLAQDPELGGLTIDVETNGGRVTLRGSAPNTAARTKASDLAATVEGVRSVTNDLSVQAPG
jgi:BON domain